MSAKILSVLCGAMALLAGCGAAVDGALTQDELTTVGRVESPNISSKGVIQLGLDNVSPRFTFTGQNGNGFSAQTGSRDGEGLYAVAGTFQNQPVFEPITGNVTYSGTYHVLVIDDITLINDYISAPNVTSEEGPIDLQASFANNSFQSIGSGPLVVDAELVGTQISGDVTFHGVPGTIDGFAGGDQAVAAIYGEGNVGPGTADDYMFAGGFIADRAF
jgi:hypothetical protein